MPNIKLTTQKFINRAIKIHSNKYDYSKVEYIYFNINVIIICSIHGEFFQTPANHLKGSGCNKCGIINQTLKKKLTNEQFIKRIKKVHGNKYNYSKVEYKDMFISITVYCNICKKYFYPLPSNHLYKKSGCPFCNSQRKKLQFKRSTKKFIKLAKEVHGNRYNYSKVEYINKRTNIDIICKKHGIFQQLPYVHLRKQGCNKCVIENKKISLNNFIKRSIEIHGNKYNYDKVIMIHTKINVNITCLKCNKTFSMRPNSHLNGQGCPICNESKGEREIKKWLDKNNIKYIQQKRFKNCKNKRPLPFDFYLLNYNLLIEYDGIQHFKTFKGKWKITKEKLIKINKRDHIKTQFAFNNNINLLRIPYWDFNNIKKILSKNIIIKNTNKISNYF